MGKLIKYELKKQMISKIVIGVLAAICQIALLVGVFVDNPDWAALGFSGTLILAFSALFYFSFETIITYSNDLKTKQSYMLFLVPRNMYQVVGAKMITTLLQILLAGIAFVAIMIGDVFLTCARYGEVEAMLEMFKIMFKQLLGINMNLAEALYVICAVLVVWIEFVLMCMLAITLSTTLFSNKRYKGVISFGIYFALQFLFGKLADWVTNGAISGEVVELNAMAWIYIGVYAVAMVICFFATTWLLEKKISV